MSLCKCAVSSMVWQVLRMAADISLGEREAADVTARCHAEG